MTAAALAALLTVLIAARARPAAPKRLPAAPGAGAGRVTEHHREHHRERHHEHHRQRQRRPRSTTGSPERDAASVAAWVDQLARAVRSGAALAGAIRDADPPAHHTATVDAIVLALERGAPLREAVDVDTGSRDLALALTVLRACATHGGPPAEPLDRAAAALRARAADAAERRTHSAQARLSAVVMTVLPVAMLVLLITASGSVRSAVGTSLGLTTLAVGAALNVAGWRWMRRLIDGGPR